MSYFSFAAGAAKFGISAAARAARTYGVPLEITLCYLWRYQREGYRV